MSYSVRWTLEAKNTFNDVIDFMYIRWTDKEVGRFIERTDIIINHIVKEPQLFKPYEDRPEVRCGNVHKNVTLFYRILDDKEIIELIEFWDNRKNPNRREINK